jgi:hypothetical protein
MQRNYLNPKVLVPAPSAPAPQKGALKLSNICVLFAVVVIFLWHRLIHPVPLSFPLLDLVFLLPLGGWIPVQYLHDNCERRNIRTSAADSRAAIQS